MHKKRVNLKRFFAAIFLAMMVAGSVAGSMSGGIVHAEEVVTEIEEKNWYVLGRPMTEEEKEEQRQLIEHYRSFSGDVVQEEESGVVPVSGEMTQPISFMSSETGTATAAEGLPTEYSSWELGYTPPVRNQGNLGNCWAHASTACVEISMIKNNIVAADEIDLSESHLIYYICRPVADPLGGTSDDYTGVLNDTIYTMFNNGGTIGYSAAPFMAWMGPVAEDDFYDYDYLLEHHYEPTQLEGLDDVAHAYGNRAAIVVENVTVASAQRDAMKRAIMEYGSLGTHYYSGSEYFNFDYAAQYCDDYKDSDHAVTIVGWDDSFPKENFRKTPEGDGAWLVRNSWGTSHGNRGYFWLSYYDKSMTGGRAYRAVEADKYDNNYRYERAGNDFGYVNGVEEGSIEAANIFTIQNEKEVLKAVFVGLQWDNLKYSIQVYKNPENANDPTTGEELLEAPIQGTRTMAGQYTIDLGKTILLEKDDKIAVCVTITSDNPDVCPAAQTGNLGIGRPGESMYRVNGGEWQECSVIDAGNFVIRAFTSNVTSESEAAHVHKWQESWSSNDNGHWHECAGEGTCTASEGNAYEAHSGGTATCAARAVCDVCQQAYGFTDVQNHSGGKIRRNVVEATTWKEGYTGDVCCSGCDYIYEEGKTILMLSSDGSSSLSSVPNLNYTFTTLDEEEVSTEVGDKPKLIIFYGASCGGCINTLDNFTEQKVDGVDVLAVEVKQSEKTKVANFVNTLGVGKENIQFCYDTEYEASQARIAYEKAFHGMTYSALPVLCYIDEDNQITHVTSGQQSLNQIKSNLAVYCKLKTNNLNKENPSSATLSTLDGEEISLTADGQPKVLIFYEGMGASLKTLESVSSEKLSGSDIYAIDVLSQDAESTRQLAEQYINPAAGIKVCQNTDAILEMVKYAEAIGVTSNISYPVICYIDADNMLQHVTIGESSLAEVKINLSANCGYVEVPEKDEEPEETVKDTVAPTAAYQFGNGVWKSFGENESFGVFSKEAKVMTIDARDEGSGVQSVEYYISEEVVEVQDIASWMAYDAAGISLDTTGICYVYVKVSDKAGNSAVLHSEGIVIYEDSVIENVALDYTEKMKEDRIVNLDLRGNTVKGLYDNDGKVIDGKNYTVNLNGTDAKLTLKAAYLDTLSEGKYTYQVSLNPQGVETNAVSLMCEFKVSVQAAEEEKPVDPEIPTDPDKPEVPDKPEKEEVIRIFGADRNETSYKVADALKAELGIEKFDTVIVATGKNFADALSGSYLAVVKNAPILLTNNKDDNVKELCAYIGDNLSADGIIYILGGESAVSAEVEKILKADYEVKRLSGGTRYETSLAILEEAGIEEGTDLIAATGKDFADSLSASAVKKPIMLVKPNAALTDEQKEIAAKAGQIYIVGGALAVSADIETELAAYADVKRIAGTGRQETSRLIAEAFFSDADKVVLAKAMDFPDGLCGGPLAAAMNAPLLLTRDGKSEIAESYVQNAGMKSGIVLGGSSALADETVEQIFN